MRVLCTISPCVRLLIDLPENILNLPLSLSLLCITILLHFIIYLLYTLLTQNAKPRIRRILYFDIPITEASTL